MNRKKYGVVFCLLVVIAMISLGTVSIYVNHEEKKETTEQLRVVTSFYPMYVAAMNVTGGCKSVILENLSEPQTGCLHDYQLTPEDMVLLSKADVFIINGGGIENFLSEVASRYPNLTIIEAGEGIEMSGENAHLWMDTEKYQKQVQNIAKGLSEVDETNKKIYQKNADAYCEQIADLTEEYRDTCNGNGQKVVLFHEGLEYAANEWNMNDVYTLNLDEERQVSAGEVADVLSAIQKDGAKMILAERTYGEELAESVKKETNVPVVYLDTCVRGKYEKDAYLKAMRSNLEALKEALQ